MVASQLRLALTVAALTSSAADDTTTEHFSYGRDESNVQGSYEAFAELYERDFNASYGSYAESASSTFEGENAYDPYGDFSYDFGGACETDWVGDGDCDRYCNTAEFRFDDGDCFHDNDGCFNDPVGADYRGSVNVTRDGWPCQFWDRQLPRQHTYTISSFPDANLGGHNACRNPAPEELSEGPWCIVASEEVGAPVWQYCNVGSPSVTPCPASTLMVHNHTELILNEWRDALVREHHYDYYKLALPPGLAGFQIVLVPLTGDPSLFVDFETQFPTGHQHAYKQDGLGPEVFYMTSGTYGYCKRDDPEPPPSRIAPTGGERERSKLFGSGRALAHNGRALDDEAPGCELYFSVSARETSHYKVVVLDAGGNTACGDGCAWKQLGDGECQPQCFNDGCFEDLGDCTQRSDFISEFDEEGGGGRNHSVLMRHCHAACAPSWIDDGYCDVACFNAKCNYDGGDCGGPGCSDGCMKKLRGNGECNAACNVESCRWDNGDCFHKHNECYRRKDGSDYRGTVSHTTTGRSCQRWSDQEPNVHTRTHEHFPLSGLGGHNFCRNPDHSEVSPWCYTQDGEGPRFELCDVGSPSIKPCPKKKKDLLSSFVAALPVENPTVATSLGIGLGLGAGLVALAVFVVMAGAWYLRARAAEKGLYIFGAPPRAEAIDEVQMEAEAAVGDKP